MAEGAVNEQHIKDLPASLTTFCPQLTATSLNLPADLPFDRWQGIGQALAHAARCLPWWIGDWWAFGEHRYGERYKAAEELPFNAHTCETYASVARAFAETSRRMEVLSFTHHQIVASLDPAQADELLAWCAEPVATGGKPRSTRSLWKQRDALLGETRYPSDEDDDEDDKEAEEAEEAEEQAQTDRAAAQEKRLRDTLGVHAADRQDDLDPADDKGPPGLPPKPPLEAAQEPTRLRNKDPKEWDVAEALKVWHQAASSKDRQEFGWGLSEDDLDGLIGVLLEKHWDNGDVAWLYNNGAFEDNDRVALLPEGVDRDALDQWLRQHCGKGLDEE